MQITRFFVALKKKTYAFRWTNQKSKSCGIGQKKNSAALIDTFDYKKYFTLTFLRALCCINLNRKYNILVLKLLSQQSH